MRSFPERIAVALFLATISFGVTEQVAASERQGTHREQSARRYCWKRIGLKPDDTPTTHQAERLKPCVTKRLGHEDPYMDQF